MELVAPAYKVELKMFVPSILDVWPDMRSTRNDSTGNDGAALFFYEEIVGRVVRQANRALHPIMETAEDHARGIKHISGSMKAIRKIHRVFGQNDGLLTIAFEVYAPLPVAFGKPRANSLSETEWVQRRLLAPIREFVEQWATTHGGTEYEKWRRLVYAEIARELRDLEHQCAGFANLKVEKK